MNEGKLTAQQRRDEIAMLQTHLRNLVGTAIAAGNIAERTLAACMEIAARLERDTR